MMLNGSWPLPDKSSNSNNKNYFDMYLFTSTCRALSTCKEILNFLITEFIFTFNIVNTINIMDLFQDKMCTICHKQYDTLLKNYEDIMLSEIPVLKFEKQIQLKSLCMWCVTVLKKMSKFLTLILESQKIQINHQVNRKIQDYRHHNLSICVNDPVHIPSFSEVYVEEVNKELFYNEDLNVRKINSINEEKNKVLIRKSKTQSIYSDMKFKIEFLSIENQRQEIKRRKESLKYKERLYKCEDCGLGFLTADVFEDHRKRHMMESGQYICEICSLRFKSKAVLSQHVLLHSRLFICIECGMKIKKWSNAVTHRHKCGSVCVTDCVYCGKVFGNTHSLEVHIKGHTKENKYECTECKRKFGTKQRLRVHTRLHTGFKPFICECGKKFTTKSNLKSHQNVHSHVKNHYCVECNKFYKTDRGLKKHLSESVKHARGLPIGFRCSYCNKAFSSETTLSYHQSVRHFTKYTCDTCNKNFSSNSNLRKHIRLVHNTEVLSE